MEKLQGGPIMNPCLFVEARNAETCEPFEEEEEEEEEEEKREGGGVEFPWRLTRSQSLEDNNMPFLEMLQSVESPAMSFQALPRKQQHGEKPLDCPSNYTGLHTIPPALLEQPESCLTNDGVPTTTKQQETPVKFEATRPRENKEKRKKTKKPRLAKNSEELESQRMTHIAVERNRRRLMNDHLTALRSLMPPSYIHKGDQASTIGGAIELVKELEQRLQSLQARKKRMRKSDDPTSSSTSSSSSSSAAAVSPDCGGMLNCEVGRNCVRGRDELSAEMKSAAVEVKATVIQNHVNLKVETRARRPGQLLRAIVALEDVGLTVLHLNITSMDDSILYSFNLKMEDDCELGSANGVAVAVYQIFSIINGSP